MTLPLIFWAFSDEFGEAGEDDFEHAAQFAGLDHVDEEAVEDFGVLSQGLGEGAAAFDGQGQFAEDTLEGHVALLLFQDAQPAQQGQAGVHQRGQLAGEGGKDLGFDLAAQAGDFDLKIEGAAFLFGAAFACGGPGLFVGLGFGLIDLDDFGGEKVHFLDPADGLVLAGDFQGAFGFLAVGVHRDVTVFWHTLLSVRCI